MKKSLAILLMAVSPVALAQGVYVGAGVGQASYDVGDTTGIVAPRVDDSDTGFKLYGGYQFTPNIAVEAGYADLGEARLAGIVLGIPFDSSFEASALYADVVGTLPLGSGFSVFGRLGVAMTFAELNVATAGGSASVDDDEGNVKFGLGAEFAFSRDVAMRLEWERYVDVGGDNTGESDVDLAGVSLNVRF